MTKDTRLQEALTAAHCEPPRPFPHDFILGAAAAAFQIEGATNEGGRGPSIWDTFAGIPGAVVGGDTGDIACDHYHRYKDDVALMRKLSLDSYRFSVSWARVCPDGVSINKEGLDFYKRLVDELLDSDILPWLTLYHWDLPQRLQDSGGWVARDTAQRFGDYSMTVHEALGDRVHVWTTLNEPWCSSFLSYTAGEHAPGHFSLAEGMLASHHLLLGHGWVIQELRRQDPAYDVGLTLNMTIAQPLEPDSPGDQKAAQLVDGQINRWFLDPLFRGQYPSDILQAFADVDPTAVDTFRAAVLPGDLDVISTPIDTLGINYYKGDVVTAATQPPSRLRERGIVDLGLLPSGGAPTTRATQSPMPASRGFTWPDSRFPRTDQNWDVDPAALKALLLRVHEEYTGPAETAIYVTENGAAYDDEVTDTATGPKVHDPQRDAYIQLHLGAVLDAIDEGADVRGYFYWSLLDNFEWTWGYGKRFGIIYVDYETQERIIKDSGLAYSRITRERALAVAPNAGSFVRRNTLLEGRDS